MSSKSMERQIRSASVAPYGKMSYQDLITQPRYEKPTGNETLTQLSDVESVTRLKWSGKHILWTSTVQ